MVRKTSLANSMVVVLLTMVIMIVVTGCAKERKVVWEPKPYVGWDRIVAEHVPRVENGYHILVPQPSKGLFPASLGVCRVVLEPYDENVQVVGPKLRTDPRNEFLQWNSAFDNLMAVSEVFPIDQFTLGGGRATPEQILASYRAVDAGLGLIYAVNELGESTVEMIGVLYKCSDGKPLAVLRTQAESTMTEEEKKESDEPINLWETDARALVRQRFEAIAHACLRDLILNDHPAELEDSSGWKRISPVRPPEWPPTQDTP